MLKCLVGQVVLHGERNGQRINLLGGHDSPQGHTAQVLEARNTAWGSPEMHTAITRPEKTNSFYIQTNTQNRFAAFIIIFFYKGSFKIQESVMKVIFGIIPKQKAKYRFDLYVLTLYNTNME